MKYDIVALGELLIDFAFVSADTDGYPTMAAHPGGAPANFLAAAAKQGAKTALIGKVGADSFGHMLRSTLEKAGIGTEGLITDDSVFTTLAFVTLDENGDREFSFARKPGADTRLTPDELPYELIDNARVFHFGTLSLTDEPARSATYRAVEYAKKCGRLITFDPNLRRPLWKSPDDAREQMLWGLTVADVVKISGEEAEFLFDLPPEAAAEKILDAFAAKLVFVTCGADGCLCANAHASARAFNPPDIKAIDTTGAGDIFGGTAVWKLLESGKSPDELTGDELYSIASYACAAAALSVTRPGGISSVPEKGQLEALFR